MRLGSRHDEHGTVGATGEQCGVGDREERRSVEDDEVVLRELLDELLHAV